MEFAARSEQQGDLHKALYEYRIASTVSDHSPVVTREIKRLKKQILKKTGELFSKAEKLYSKGNIIKAEELYLDILTLNPQHRKAFSRLREISKKSLLTKMEKKVALSQYYRKKKSRHKNLQSDEDEGYIYSRQAILQSENRATDVSKHIEGLEKHLKKYPKDDELKDMLIKIRIVQARSAFRSSEYDKSLNHLLAAEKLFQNDPAVLKKVSALRRELGKELYLKGVRSARSQPMNAVELWRTALKYDPDDKRSQLRIDNLMN